MNSRKCQQRLAILWFAVSAILFGLLFLQTVLGAYAEPKDAWNWLVPNLLPTLSLMIGIFVADVSGTQPGDRADIAPFLFWLTFAISGTYLLTIFLMVILQPFSVLSPLQLMKQGQLLWLAPLQGLVTASLGAFFVKASKKPAN